MSGIAVSLKSIGNSFGLSCFFPTSSTMSDSYANHTVSVSNGGRNANPAEKVISYNYSLDD